MKGWIYWRRHRSWRVLEGSIHKGKYWWLVKEASLMKAKGVVKEEKIMTVESLKTQAKEFELDSGGNLELL